MDNDFVMVYKEDVKQYGIIRATILGKIKGWCDTNEKAKRYKFDGFYWSGHITKNEMAEQIGISLDTTKKNLKWLLDNEIIIRGNYNKNRYDKTGWYRPNPSCLRGTYPGTTEAPTQEPERPNGKSMRDPMDSTSETQTIPNIPTNIHTNNQSSIHTTITTNNPLIKLSEFDRKHITDKLYSMNLHNELFSALMDMIEPEGYITKNQKKLIQDNINLFKKMGILQPFFKSFQIQ